LSHQFAPDVGVEVVDGGAVVALVFGAVEVRVTGGTLVEVVVFVVVVVVAVVQEARTRDDTIRIVSAIQIAPLFIVSSLYAMENIWKIDYDLFAGICLRVEKFLSVRSALPLTPITPRAPVTGGNNNQLSCKFDN
jgi:hypothetical protein